ncbi:hypothetical protein D3C75_797840 [compost metagenome]
MNIPGHPERRLENAVAHDQAQPVGAARRPLGQSGRKGLANGRLRAGFCHIAHYVRVLLERQEKGPVGCLQRGAD